MIKPLKFSYQYYGALHLTNLSAFLYYKDYGALHLNVKPQRGEILIACMEE
jgi:hypothetical protein